MTILNQNNVEERMKDIISLAGEGKTKSEIARLLGYTSYKALHAYTKRHGYVWDEQTDNYVKAKTEQEEQAQEQKSIQYPKGRVGSVLELFDKGLDAREIARKLRFQSALEMADFMRDNSYMWNSSTNTYVYTPPEPQIEETGMNSFASGFIGEFYGRYSEVLNLLVSNREKLEVILGITTVGDSTIPRYVIPGVLVTKSMHMPNSLDMLCKEFSDRRNVTQKDIILVALIEFFNKYGFKDEVTRILKTR